MKVKMIRQSYTPVKDSVNKEMMDEYKLNYDKLTELHGTDMQSLHSSIEELIGDLRSKYEDRLSEYIDMPKSGKQWKQLLDQYGAVIVGSHVDTGELLLIIMDEEDRGVAV